MPKINTIIFDLGGVLIDWNPKYLYRKVFNGDNDKVNWFLDNICTMEWNVKQDAGRQLTKGTELLIEKYPQYERWIKMYYGRWAEMLGGPIKAAVNLFNELNSNNNLKLYALTNWSAETFPIALERYDFLHNFDGIVVSGEEKMRKPFPEIYQLILERYKLSPQHSIFIDDNKENVDAAERFGINGIHFTSSTQLKAVLQEYGLITK